MKSSLKLRIPLLTCGSLLAVSSLHAADVTWDTVGPGNGTVTGGTGTWDTTITNWTTDGGVTNVAWNNGNNDTAIFGGTAGAVTLGSDVTVGGLTFNTTNYSIAPGAGPFKITLGADTELNANYASNVNSMSAINAEIVGSSTITKTGTGFLRLDAISDSFTGNIVVSGGTLQIGNNANLARLGGPTYAGDINLDGGTLFLKNQTQTFSGVISGTGILNKGGSGILTLSGANTYTGQTRIQGSGAGGPGLSVSSFNSVNETQTGAVMASSSLGAPTTVANGTILFGNSGNQRSSTLIYTGAGETTNRVMEVGFNSGSFHQLDSSGTGLLKFTSAFQINASSGTNASGLNLTGAGDGEIGAGFVGDVIPGRLDKDGTGTWTITGSASANSTTVRAGTLILNGAFSTLETSRTQGGNLITYPVGALTVDSGATLQIGNGGTEGSMSGASDYINNGALIYNRSNDLSVAYVTDGTGTLEKKGAGTLTITSTNTYTGATTVSAGTLSVDGTGSINNSDVTVNGGTFRYNSSVAYSGVITYTAGTIGGTNLTGGLGGQTIGAGQTLSPGNSPGTAATTSQTWADGGSYLWEVNDTEGTAGADPGWDLINGTGTLTITDVTADPFTILVTSLTLGNAAGDAENFDELSDYEWLLADFASITNFAADAFNIDTSDFANPFTGDFGISLGGGSLPGDNSQIYLTYTAAATASVIPEPSAALLGCLGALLLLRRRR